MCIDQKFPELKFKYVEEDQPEDFFIPYVWSLVFNSGVGLHWSPQGIELFSMDSAGWQQQWSEIKAAVCPPTSCVLSTKKTDWRRARACVHVCVYFCLWLLLKVPRSCKVFLVVLLMQHTNSAFPLISEIPLLTQCSGVCLQRTHAATDACCNAAAFLHRKNRAVKKKNFSKHLNPNVVTNSWRGGAEDSFVNFWCGRRKVKAVCRKKKKHLGHDSLNISYRIFGFSENYL